MKTKIKPIKLYLRKKKTKIKPIKEYLRKKKLKNKMIVRINQMQTLIKGAPV